MQALQKIQIENNSELGAVVSSRVVAEEIGRQHKHVLEGIDEMIKKSRADISTLLIPHQYKARNGKRNREYLLTKDGFTLYMFNIQGHNDFKMAYINKFNEMENQLKQPIASYMIEDPVKRAELWIEEQKEKQQLQLENSMQKQKIAEYEPKASYLDTILNNKSLVTVGQIAKDYGMSAQALNKLLHELKVQYKQSGQWLLYSNLHAKGYTHSSTTEIEHKDGSTSVRMNTKWTQKGRLFIYELLKEHDILPVIEKEA
ncbi:phage regulatory protein/antirepressor Ant [Staphylococcus epidermidis]|jgi:Rha family phage regulatory protein|uniref:phage antirepressor KilAC domain-containing protein n=1 Tax=Staphylococcus epidermidis TaxID=1282 RepID=UPI000207CEC9|nr:phage regulatory protein/antirepressor Ant [Staphylococcus epidermidis]EGG71172.1 phage regulatory protein, Rha family [Staphylococcus epidermidis VCU028]MBM6042242.1 phage regulatory protein/antirepressor Ant [Staphylococcus epidermidis]MBM6322180.1 phage regulatory protein/antirepressor Ant [Staphylococcus epidermidis]MCG2248542.1 phage regulatory protein/antirepressor Ant [Staphylococcus epidermidis]MCG2258499.1 phage regulatory protein/antirepressor Ant [Staphylococcus epidermidis]